MPPRNGNKKGQSQTDAVDDISQYRWLRPSMLVITTNVRGTFRTVNTDEVNGSAAAVQRTKISQLMNSIWQLDNSNNIRWLFITDDSAISKPMMQCVHCFGSYFRFEVGVICTSLMTEDESVGMQSPIPSIEGPCQFEGGCCLFTRPRCSEKGRRVVRTGGALVGLKEILEFVKIEHTGFLFLSFSGAELAGDPS